MLVICLTVTTVVTTVVKPNKPNPVGLSGKGREGKKGRGGGGAIDGVTERGGSYGGKEALWWGEGEAWF